jgi:hypothetical protein
MLQLQLRRQVYHSNLFPNEHSVYPVILLFWKPDSQNNYEELYKIQLEWRNNVVNEQQRTLEGIEKVLNTELKINAYRST